MPASSKAVRNSSWCQSPLALNTSPGPMTRAIVNNSSSRCCCSRLASSRRSCAIRADSGGLAYRVAMNHESPAWRLTRYPVPPRGVPTISLRAQERAERIRELFLKEFGGLARIEDVRGACLEEGLLNGVRNPHAQLNVIRAALSVIAEPSHPW